MSEIVIRLPDTPEMRSQLDMLATLCAEDEADHFDGEAEDARFHGKHEKAKEMEGRAAACRKFWEVVTLAIHPEVAELAKEQG